MEEIFKDIKDYEGLYQVSNLGRVISLPKNDGNGNRLRELKHDLNVLKCGTYSRVTFSKFGKTKRFSVHRLVAEAFIPNPENKPMVNHIDNNPQNNHVTNLEWCTHTENMLHSSKQGRQDKVRSLGGRALADKVIAEGIKKYQQLLGEAFIALHPKGTAYSFRKISYKCRGCFQTTTEGTSAIAVRTGIATCRSCRIRMKI